MRCSIGELVANIRLQRTRQSRAPLRLGVIAPSEARRLLPGESPGRVRVSRPPVSRVGLMAERGNPRTRWGKRTPRILSAVGEIAFPEVRVQLRNKLMADADRFNVLAGNTKHPLWHGCGGPPESLSPGRQEERRGRTRQAPKAPGRGETLKPTGLGHARVKSPDTAGARVAASSTERPGRPATAVCQGGFLSGIVVGGWESQPQGEHVRYCAGGAG